MLQLTALPAMSDNYIWLLDDSAHLLIIDPGVAAPVMAHLQATGRVPSAILITHHHPDHIGGVETLLAHWPTLRVYAPHEPRIPLASHRVSDGERISDGLPLSFTVFEVPGHTRSHVAYYGEPTDQAPLLFCGDTMFSLGCGRLFEGTPAQMHHSLQRLAALPANTRVCCAHEYTSANLRFVRSLWPDAPGLSEFARELDALRDAGLPSLPSSIAREARLNPFLFDRLSHWHPVLARALGVAESVDPASLFAALRRAKDQFA